jgi:hypothetical protein
MFTPVCSQLYDWILNCPLLNINGWGFLQTHAALLSKTKGALEKSINKRYKDGFKKGKITGVTHSSGVCKTSTIHIFPLHENHFIHIF